jgi:hypothetical protein
MHAFRQNPLGLSGYTAFFVSSAKPGLGHLSVIRAAYIGLMDLLARAPILLLKPLVTVRSFLATVCASSLAVLYPYIEQRQGQASSNLE